jgi:hypothetical protein
MTPVRPGRGCGRRSSSRASPLPAPGPASSESPGGSSPRSTPTLRGEVRGIEFVLHLLVQASARIAHHRRGSGSVDGPKLDAPRALAMVAPMAHDHPRGPRRILRRGAASGTPSCATWSAGGGRPPGERAWCSRPIRRRRYGIHAGMPIGQAVRLCPRPPSSRAPSPLPRRLARGAGRAPAPLSHGRDGVADEAYLDFAGTERLYPVSLLPQAELPATTSGATPGSIAASASAPTA